MKLVVAGGSGLIGRHLVPRLLRDGDDVVVLSRDAERAAKHLPPAAGVTQWSAGDATGRWRGVLDRADAVVNLAGASLGTWPWTARTKRALRASRLEPTRALVAAVASLPPGRRPVVLVSASGTDLYEGRDREPATEACPPVDTFLGRLCLDWEATARHAESLGVRVVCLRTSLVIAPHAPALERLMAPFRFFLGGPIGSGQQWMSWVDIHDAVEMISWTIRTPDLRGPVNVSAPDPRRQRDFARAIGEALHRPHRLRAPGWLVRLVLGEQAILLLGSRRVWPGQALSRNFEFAVPRLELALARALTATPPHDPRGDGVVG